MEAEERLLLFWQKVLSMLWYGAAGEDTQQHHGNSLASRRDWQELESGRSMEEHTLAAAAPPAPAAIRAWGALPQNHHHYYYKGGNP